MIIYKYWNLYLTLKMFIHLFKYVTHTCTLEHTDLDFLYIKLGQTNLGRTGIREI